MHSPGPLYSHGKALVVAAGGYSVLSEVQPVPKKALVGSVHGSVFSLCFQVMAGRLKIARSVVAFADIVQRSAGGFEKIRGWLVEKEAVHRCSSGF